MALRKLRVEPLEDRCLLAVFAGEQLAQWGTAEPQVSQGPVYDQVPPITPDQQALWEAYAGAQPDPSSFEQSHPAGPESDSPSQATEHALDPNATPTTAAPEDFRLYRNSDLPVSFSSPTNEPSVASLDQGMFVTRNWSAAVSSDHGKSWSNISPYTTFGSIDGGFCCDQRAAHDENRDMLVWYLQYIKSGNTSGDQGGIRIARTNTQSTLALNLWTSYVFEPSNFGYGTGEWLDFPDMEFTDTFAYFTSNVFATTNDAYVGSAYWRINLDELQAGGSVNYSWTTVTTGTIGLATNAEDTMYAATYRDASTIRVFTWPDNSNTITIDDVGGLATTYSATHTSIDVNGFNWTARSDRRIQSGYVAGDTVGFFWNSSQGGSRPKPFVRAAVLNRISKAVLSQPDVWHPTVTWHYPAISSNGRGHLGGTIGYNTENGPVGTQILLDDDFTSGWQAHFGSLGNDGPMQNRWGDYLDAKPDDDFPNTWIATGFHHDGTTTTTDFFWFGRERDTPCGGPDDHGNNFGVSSSVGVPSSTAGSIELDCDVDWFRFNAEAGGTYTISTSLGSLGDSVLALFAPDGATQLAFDDDGGPGLASRIRWTAPSPATYYIRAQSFANSDSGTYILRVERQSFYISLDVPGTVTNGDGTTLTADDSDILELRHFPGGYSYRLFFDGSDQGLTTAAEDIDAFSILDDGSILISTVGGFSVPGLGGNIVGSDEDLLRFVPTRTGPTTLGTWDFYFDGSDVGLLENIDAVEGLADGRILISSSVGVTVPGATGTDSDVFAFQPATLGTNTDGTWTKYFDAAAFGLTTAAEDVDALAVGPSGPSSPNYFSTSGVFSVTGAAGGKGDVFRFDATGLAAPINGVYAPGLTLAAALIGLGTKNIDGLELAETSPLFVSVLGEAPSNGQKPSLDDPPVAPISSKVNAEAPTMQIQQESSLFEAFDAYRKSAGKRRLPARVPVKQSLP